MQGATLGDRLKAMGASAETAERILHAYEGRAYHNARHIARMLDYALARREDEELFWAIVFHDIVYIPGGSCNEELSALKAREFLDLDEASLQKIDALIMATKSHPTSPWAVWNEAKSAIVDADLIGFVENWEENSRNVRQEFKQYSDEDFAKGRIAFLQAFGARRPFFCDPETEKRFGDVARANIAKEIARLEGINDLESMAAELRRIRNI